MPHPPLASRASGTEEPASKSPRLRPPADSGAGIDVHVLRQLLREEISGLLKETVGSLETKIIKRVDEHEKILLGHGERLEAHDTALALLQKNVAVLQASSSAASSTRGSFSPAGGGASVASSSLDGRQLGAFVPRFFTVKGYCEWGERMSKGLEDSQITEWLDKVKALLPASLAAQVRGHSARSWKSYSFDVYTVHPKACLDLMWEVVRFISSSDT